jgi:hypothetical protein
VALVDANGRLVAKRRISDDVDGFTALVVMLADAGDSDADPIPVAMETPRGLFVAALRATGRPVYAINPMAVARYRERWTVARSKSDHADAVVLVNILRTDAHAHRSLPADSELAQAITVLARAHQDATRRRTKVVQELRAHLREYYPGFLEAFAAAGVTNLASADARAVLAIAPTPAAGARLNAARISAALRRGGRPTGQRLRARGRSTATRRPPNVTEPRPCPWRTAARLASCLPFGPHASVISTSSIAAMTAIPAATLIAISPSRAAPAISVMASAISFGRSGSAATSVVLARRTVGTVFMAVPYPPFVVYLAVHPKTYHPAGLR